LNNFNGRRFDHSCDANGGMSGAPFYIYDAGAVYVAGVHIGLDGFQPATPFKGTRIDTQFYGWMLDFMN